MRFQKSCCPSSVEALISAIGRNNDDENCLRNVRAAIDFTHDYGCVISIIDGKEIKIPYRVKILQEFEKLFLENDAILTKCEKALLTRSTNGYVRERFAKHAFSIQEEWIVPFILLLSADYVLPIVRIINDNFSRLDKNDLESFLSKNPSAANFVSSRIISYWNAYYRDRFPFDDYPGADIIQKISSAIRR